MVYNIIKQAILHKQSLTGTYQRRIRHFSPHAIGQSDDGQTNVMAFQYGGDSSKGLPPGGEWRCFEVEQLSGVSVNGDAWQTGNGFSSPNTCVTRIDVTV